MADLPSRTDLFEVGAAEIASRSAARPVNQRISASEVFTEGSDINVVTASASAMGEEVVRQLCLEIAALYLDTAEGEALDRLVADRFSPTIVRKEATPAVVTLQFSRSSGALPAETFPAQSRYRTANGIEFATSLAASLPAGSYGPVTVTATCVDTGQAGNVAANTVTQFNTPPADSAIVVTNPEPAAGGDDPETDARLRQRARDFYNAARRGTVAAIEFGALTVAGVRLASVTEEVDQNGDETGRVSLAISDAQGQGNAALAAAVRGALLEYRAAGVVVDVIAAVPVFQAIALRLRFRTGVDPAVAFASVQQAVLASVNALAPGATLPVSLITAAARQVQGVIVLDDAVQTPAGDVVPAQNEVIRTTLALVTAV